MGTIKAHMFESIKKTLNWWNALSQYQSPWFNKVKTYLKAAREEEAACPIGKL